jgi:hypothetical protein
LLINTVATALGNVFGFVLQIFRADGATENPY